MLGSLSIVIPIYNCDQSLPFLLARLEPLLPTLADAAGRRARVARQPPGAGRSCRDPPRKRHRPQL